MEKNSLYWNEALIYINKQTDKAIILLKERHGDDFSQPLADQFRCYPIFEKISKSVWSGISDTAVKEWYFETYVILENFISPTNECLKKFKNLIKSPQIDAFGFDSLNSGDFLKTCIEILQDCMLYLERKIHSLKDIETKFDSDTKEKTESQGRSDKFSIFISHINEDKDLAVSLKELFLSAFGNKVEVFVSSDLDSITLGANWFNRIIDALKKCDIAIIFCNKTSITRPWINFETGAVYIRDVPTIPLCCDDLTAGELPSPLNNLQAANALNPNHIDRIISQISQEIKCPIPSLEIENSQFYSVVLRSSERARNGTVTIVASGEQSYSRGEPIQFSGTSTVKSPNVDLMVFRNGLSWPPVFKKQVKVHDDCIYEVTFDSRILEPGAYTVVVEGLNESSGTVTINVK